MPCALAALRVRSYRAMPYMHKAKWGSVDALAKRSLVIDPHLFSAPVGTIRVGDKGERDLMFWRTKTRCSTRGEWMELHDAHDGACLWRAEARYCDRAAPVLPRAPTPTQQSASCPSVSCTSHRSASF